MKQFSIERVVECGLQFEVDGRCYIGPIAIGEVVTGLGRVEKEKITLVQTGLSLRVVRFVTYGHDVDQIDNGLTGRVTLEGGGGVHLESGLILCIQPSSG